MTRVNIGSCLEEIEDDKSKRNFVALMLKLDIRAQLMQGGAENYYKIWVIRKDVGKKTYYTDYYHNPEEKMPCPTLKDILNNIPLMIDVPKSYREYCGTWFPKPSKEDHLRHLKLANRFDGVLDRVDIESIPPFSKNIGESKLGDKDEQDYQRAAREIREGMEKKIIAEKIRKCRKSGFITIRIRATEYRHLLDLRDDIQYSKKLLKQYGFDEMGNFNTNKFPVPRSDKEVEGIENDISNYDNMVSNLLGYIEQLVSDYSKTLSPKGVIFYPPRKALHNKFTTPLIINLSETSQLKN